MSENKNNGECTVYHPKDLNKDCHIDGAGAVLNSGTVGEVIGREFLSTGFDHVPHYHDKDGYPVVPSKEAQEQGVFSKILKGPIEQGAEKMHAHGNDPKDILYPVKGRGRSSNKTNSTEDKLNNTNNDMHDEASSVGESLKDSGATEDYGCSADGLHPHPLSFNNHSASKGHVIS